MKWFERNRSVATDPIAFERHCAELLSNAGWHASATKGSGDQGADVVADKAGHRLVLQCKFYTGSVGNKAVQEAHAALSHYRAQSAAVVTNSVYTPGANALAHSTGVLLLAPRDLLGVDVLLGLPTKVARGCRNCRTTLMLQSGRAGIVQCPICGNRQTHIT